MKIFYDELNGMLCIDESIHIIGCGAVVTVVEDIVEISQSKSTFNDIAEPYTDILDHSGKNFLTAESCVEYLEGEIDKCWLFFRGDTAYEIAVSNGFVGTEAEWLDSLKGTAANPIPAGVKWETYASIAPSGWYVLNGQTISSDVNPILATIFGESDGLITLPDERGRGSKMLDGLHSLGDQVGHDTQNINHSHSFSATTSPEPDHDHGGETGTDSGSRNASLLGIGLGPVAPANHDHEIDHDGGHDHSVSGDTGSGGTTTLDVRGAVTYLNWIIKGG